MSIKKINEPSQYETYGRKISRKEEMFQNIPYSCKCSSQHSDEGRLGYLSSSDYNIENVGEISSPLPIKSTLYNNCECFYNSNNNNEASVSRRIPNESFNNAFFFKYNNLRIRYVGFIFNSINYIVDLDNKKVFYKPFKESRYTKLRNKISTTVNSLTKAYTVSFNLMNEFINVVVEVYPYNIYNCSVTLIDLNNYEKQVLDKQYTNIEFFDIKNMLDKNGNIVTFIDYSDVFKLTEEDIASLYTYPEMVKMIFSIINTISNQKDLILVVKNILLEIRNKMLNPDKDNDIYNDNNSSCIEDMNFEFCDCFDTSHLEHTKLFDITSITLDDLIGTYFSSNENQTIILSKQDEDYIVTADFLQPVKEELEESSNINITYKKAYSIDNNMNPNGILIILINKDTNEELLTLGYDYKHNVLEDLSSNTKRKFVKVFTGEFKTDLNIKITSYSGDHKKLEEKLYEVYNKGKLDEELNNEIHITLPNIPTSGYITFNVLGQLNESIVNKIELILDNKLFNVDICKKDGNIFGMLHFTSSTLNEIKNNNLTLNVSYYLNKDKTELKKDIISIISTE